MSYCWRHMVLGLSLHVGVHDELVRAYIRNPVSQRKIFCNGFCLNLLIHFKCALTFPRLCVANRNNNSSCFSIGVKCPWQKSTSRQ